MVAQNLTLGVWNSKQQKSDSDPEIHLEKIISNFGDQLCLALSFMKSCVLLALAQLGILSKQFLASFL